MLNKAIAIKIANEKRLDDIQTKKGKEIIIHHQCNLQNKPPPHKKQKTSHDSQASACEEIDDQLMTLSNNTSTRSVDDIISSWRYKGAALTRETIAFHDFITLDLERFEDLIRLHNAYDKLLDKYSRVLTDEEESRVSMIIVLSNMEILQIAIEQIYGNLVRAKYKTEVDNAMATFMKTISGSLKTLHATCPGLAVDLEAKIVNEVKYESIMEFNHDSLVEYNHDNLVEFHRGKKLSCQRVFAKRECVIDAIEPYVMDDKQYFATGGSGHTIKLWDLSKYRPVATLSGHKDTVYALKSYVKNGVQMLASGGCDQAIKVWDLSKNTNVHTFDTLDYQPGYVMSLAVHKKNGKQILISGHRFGRITLLDLDTNSIITTLDGHRKIVDELTIYSQNGKSYLASISRDGTIKIWDLDNYKSLKYFGEENVTIYSLTKACYKGKMVLATGDDRGNIKVWSLEDYKLILTIKAGSGGIYSLETVRYKGMVCLICNGDQKTMNIWSIENKTCVASFKNDSIVNKIKVFSNGGEACLLSGDYDGYIKLWMEE